MFKSLLCLKFFSDLNSFNLAQHDHHGLHVPTPPTCSFLLTPLPLVCLHPSTQCYFYYTQLPLTLESSHMLPLLLKPGPHLHSSRARLQEHLSPPCLTKMYN